MTLESFVHSVFSDCCKVLPLAVVLGPLFTLCSPTVVCVASGLMTLDGLCSLCVLRLLYVLPLAVTLRPLFTLCSPTVVTCCLWLWCCDAFFHSVFSDCCTVLPLAVMLRPLFTLCSPTVVCVASGCDVATFVPHHTLTGAHVKIP